MNLKLNLHDLKLAGTSGASEDRSGPQQSVSVCLSLPG